MRLIEIGPHKIRLYDSIDNIPPNRESLMSYYMLQSAGVGSTWESIDSHLNSLLMIVNQGDTAAVYQEIENLRLNYWSMIQKYNPEHLSFLCLIESIDGEPIDTTEDALEELSRRLGQYPTEKEFLWRQCFDEIKKKLPTSFERSFLNSQIQNAA